MFSLYIFFVHAFSSQTTWKTGLHVHLASGLTVRLAPDAWASRTLLVHIDRRQHHDAGAIISCMLSKVQAQDCRVTTEQPSSSSPSFKLLSPYLSALYLLYTSSTEYRRSQQGDGSSRQGFLRTVRCVDQWGKTRVRQSSTTTPVP